MFTNASFIEEFRQLCKRCPALQSMYVTGAISTNKYLPKWFKWKNAYYSLLHNQPCCIYKKHIPFYPDPQSGQSSAS